MSTQTPRVHLIYLRSDGMLVSKKRYADWREIQDEYEGYMTSLGPFTEDELANFLENQYGPDEARWGFTMAELRAFMQSGAEVLAAREVGC